MGVGDKVGDEDGAVVGSDAGEAVGVDEGADEGADDGVDVGTDEGTDDGVDVGAEDGDDVGADDGVDVGDDDGNAVGGYNGDAVGAGMQNRGHRPGHAMAKGDVRQSMLKQRGWSETPLHISGAGDGGAVFGAVGDGVGASFVGAEVGGTRLPRGKESGVGGEVPQSA